MILFLLILRVVFGLSAIAAIGLGARRAGRALWRPRAGDYVVLLLVGLALSRAILIARGVLYPTPPGSPTEAALVFFGYAVGILAEAGVLALLVWERGDG